MCQIVEKKPIGIYIYFSSSYCTLIFFILKSPRPLNWNESPLKPNKRPITLKSKSFFVFIYCFTQLAELNCIRKMWRFRLKAQGKVVQHIPRQPVKFDNFCVTY